ncbi:hypothetical protein BKA62DRAFT_771476 [Auriculariales sp. MPI-PUGE-AT-0066]|nr:hypothetical protein BKA62DRAFT_771476 [Auriculariales sp. MPI-PUGE-AT-0066]
MRERTDIVPWTYDEDCEAYNPDHYHDSTFRLDCSSDASPPYTSPADSPLHSGDPNGDLGFYEWGMAQYARAQSIDNTPPVHLINKRRDIKAAVPLPQTSERKRKREDDFDVDADDGDEHAREPASKRRRRAAASSAYLSYYPIFEERESTSILWSFDSTIMSEKFGNDWPTGAAVPMKFVFDFTRRSGRRVTDRLMREFVADPFTPRQTGWKRFLKRRSFHRVRSRYGARYHIDDEPLEPKWVQMMKACALRLPDN